MKAFLNVCSVLVLATIIKYVDGWGYPEDDCLKCYADVIYGEDGMYFCRHNSSGLVWG
jgi:hypothetical protein